ncbi:hypothetical protein GCM10010984_11240 [Chishuiella changwenlii]|uniref:Uncharacterized protein n=1 Tax=Chishuiella changwenlii TaxID=1434701 RepID=A0ABQ1TJL0_9FLAO|nr:hypothetical protein [Chishuiella changwenlii]GGE95468.1 hypothetical protein GCM10010984_11240 [Chishuiella changwenlii]
MCKIIRSQEQVNVEGGWIGPAFLVAAWENVGDIREALTDGYRGTTRY